MAGCDRSLSRVSKGARANNYHGPRLALIRHCIHLIKRATSSTVHAAPLLRTLMCVPMVKYEMLGLAAKYGLSDVREGLSVISDSVWSCFVQKVQL